MHTYRVTNATFVQTHYFIFLFPIFVNICDIAIIGNVYVLLCLKKLLQWAARWPPFIILTGQQVMEAAPAKYIFMRHPFNRENIWDKFCLPYPSLFSFSTSSPFYLFIGPEPDHWQCLSLPNSLPNSLLFSGVDGCEWYQLLNDVATATESFLRLIPQWS